jgi:hypothetical protein
MNEKQKLEGIQALVASYRDSSSYYEESDGQHRQWNDLSVEGKVAYIARDAVFCDTSFEWFAEAVRHTVGEQPVGVREEAYLRLVLLNHRELHELGSLLPDDGGTYATPLVDRLKEVLDWNAKLARENKDRAFDALFLQETVESTKSRLEFFCNEFTRLAKSSDLKKLAANFERFVEEVAGGRNNDAFQKMLDKSQPETEVQDMERNKNIKR